MVWSRDSSDSLVTRPQAGRPRNRNVNPDSDDRLLSFFSKVSRLPLRPIQPPIQLVLVALPVGGKVAKA
jgi:hypothetical protein